MAIDSAYTSQRQVAATFHKFEFDNLTNLDYGGGKYDDATEYLETINSTNLVFDPFNRSKAHNDEVISEVIKTGVNTITCLNVLNVVRDQSERIAILSEIKHLAMGCIDTRGELPDIYIQVYEGNRTGTPSKTTAQLNWKLDQYISEIRDLFSEDEWHLTKVGNILKFSYTLTS
jgi:hypothetical protein